MSRESSQESSVAIDPQPSSVSPGVPPPLPRGAEERFVTIDGARMRYLQQGAGPPLVLIHGLLGYSFSWRFVMPALARHATVYAIDLMGAGFSDRPPDLDCRLRSAADRFLRFLHAAGIRDLDLLGTSHGGAVAMMAAGMIRKRTDLSIRRLVLVAPVNPWSPHGRRLAPFLGSHVGSKLFLAAMAGHPLTHKLALRRLYGNPTNIPPGTLEGYAAPATQPGFFEYALKIAAHWTADLRELASVIPTLADYPAQLIWGARDRAVFVSSAATLRRQFRQCALTVFPQAGHLPYEEVPDEFNRALIDFLYPSAAQI